ncbi:MAG: hypothetical protein CW338_08415 [Clostridiales bacterium]|nr:hypothetical protein [Clostridiales bacterium]
MKPLGHDWRNKDGVCAREGCGAVCAHGKSGSSWDVENITFSDIFKSGHTWTCNVCGYKHPDLHTFADPKINPETSLYEAKCKYCGYLCQHDGLSSFEGGDYDRIEPTCTASGMAGIYRCNKCRAVLTEEGKVMPKSLLPSLETWASGDGYLAPLGHDWSNKDGVCARDGCGAVCTHPEGWTADDKCKVCGMKRTDEIRFGEYRVTVAGKIEALRNRDNYDSDDVGDIIDAALLTLNGKTYDTNKTLDENKAVLDAVYSSCFSDVTDQRMIEISGYADLVFNALAREGDSDAVKKIISDGRELSVIGYEILTIGDPSVKAHFDASAEECAGKAEAQRKKEAYVSSLTLQMAAGGTWALPQAPEGYRSSFSVESASLKYVSSPDAADACVNALTAKADSAGSSIDIRLYFYTGNGPDLNVYVPVSITVSEELTYNAAAEAAIAALEALRAKDDPDTVELMIDVAQLEIGLMKYDAKKTLQEQLDALDRAVADFSADVADERSVQAEWEVYKLRLAAAIPDGGTWTLTEPDDGFTAVINFFRPTEATDNTAKMVTSFTAYPGHIGETVTVLIGINSGHQRDPYMPNTIFTFAVTISEEMTFDAYKAGIADEIDALAEEGDSDAVQDIIAAAKDAADSMVYEAGKLDEQKAALDKLRDDCAADAQTQRDREEVEACRDAAIAEAEALRTANDDAVVTAVIDAVIAELAQVEYDPALSVADQLAAVEQIKAPLAEGLYEHFVDITITALRIEGDTGEIRNALHDIAAGLKAAGVDPAKGYHGSLAALNSTCNELEYNGVNGTRGIARFVTAKVQEMLNAGMEVTFPQAQALLTAEELEAFNALDPLSQANVMLAVLGVSDPENETAAAAAERLAAMGDEERAAFEAALKEALRTEEGGSFMGDPCSRIHLDIGGTSFCFNDRNGEWVFEKIDPAE